MKKLLVVVLFSLLQACIKDKPTTPLTQDEPLLPSKKSVYVICEGNFGNNNAAITRYVPEDSLVIENYYQQRNGLSPGDVAQSLSKIDGLWYLVMNNSGQIIICDSLFQKINAITGLRSPRYVVKGPNQMLYISDLYDNAITVVHSTSFTIAKKIKLKGWSEQLISIGDLLYIANVSSEYVYCLNFNTDEIVDSIFVGKNNRGMVLDKKKRLHVLSIPDNKTAKISMINTANRKVESTYQETNGPVYQNIAINPAGDSLYFIAKGLYVSQTDQINVQPVFVNEQANFYGIGISNDYRIYLSDALDYSQKSTISIYSTLGKKITSFKSGINANGFAFE